MNPYIGNEFQVYGVEEYTLHGGKAEGVRMLHAKNGLGLDMTISLSRNGDIVSLSYKGKNVSYITPNGIVSSNYYDNKGDGWIKSFTAGFLTTCGYDNVGVPCVFNGQELGLHGNISHTPVERFSYDYLDDKIVIKMVVLKEEIFSSKIFRERTIEISLKENKFTINDRFVNRGGEDAPLCLLYHINLGYPLLKEDSILNIDYESFEPRNEHSRKYMDEHLTMLKPTPNFQEMCYYHKMKTGTASLYSPSEKFGIKLSFDKEVLPQFVEWKMMGVRDYVLGLEPGNVTPDGRVENEKAGRVLYLKPGDTKEYNIEVTLYD